jgi:hypothetical protein
MNRRLQVLRQRFQGLGWRCVAAERADINPHVWIGQGQLQLFFPCNALVTEPDISLTKFSIAISL